MTVQQIAQDLPDVPQATLYRHLNRLVKANAIIVIQENKVRGVLERVYGIGTNPFETVTKNLDKNSKEEHLNLFYNFLMVLLGDSQRYIDIEGADLRKDGVSFRSAAVYANDEEYSEFLGDLVKAFEKILDNGPSPDRNLRKISTIIIPGVEE